jgi:hypothetical protein
MPSTRTRNWERVVDGEPIALVRCAILRVQYSCYWLAHQRKMNPPEEVDQRVELGQVLDRAAPLGAAREQAFPEPPLG